MDYKDVSLTAEHALVGMPSGAVEYVPSTAYKKLVAGTYVFEWPAPSDGSYMANFNLMLFLPLTSQTITIQLGTSLTSTTTTPTNSIVVYKSTHTQPFASINFMKFVGFVQQGSFVVASLVLESEASINKTADSRGFVDLIRIGD